MAPSCPAAVLDADAKLLFATPLTSTDSAGALFQNVAWLERGKTPPLPVTRDFYRLRTWNGKGAAVDIPVKDGVAAVALLGSKEGGPMIVVILDVSEREHLLPANHTLSAYT